MGKRAKANPLAPAPVRSPAKRDPRVFVNKLKPEETPEQASAAMMVDGLSMNTVAAVDYSKTLGVLDITESFLAVDREAKKAQAGDLGGLEAMLAAQAITLNAMFTHMAHQASQMTIVDQIDRFTRLAFKAQSQCRTTVETLALIKGGPRTVFARQANIVNGPQQVNNGRPPEGSRARAETSESAPNKLLEGVTDGERVERGTPQTSSRGHQGLAAVGGVKRAPNQRREAAKRAQRIPRR